MKVLQAFQVSHESAPNSSGYDNNSTNDGDASVTSTAVISTAPQSTSTTELCVSRVSHQFKTSVHASQTESFTDCQSTVSRTTNWILEDSSLNDTSQVLGMQKSSEIDLSDETKDEKKPKKKKRRDRCNRDLESADKFWCEICHKGYRSAYHLRRHCRNVHKMDLPKGSSDLPFGPKSLPELSFANNSQCHQQGANSSSEIVTSSAVILTTPQSTRTTELSASRVSYRFETSVHASQTEKLTDCQSTVSRTTNCILEDSSLNDTTQVLGVQKSSEIDLSGETKEEKRPKKRRDKCNRDLESAHKFWCEICQKGFRSAYNLRRHCRNVHKMDLPKGSSDLPFGPKSSPELSFVNNTQCHEQGESSSSEIVTPPCLPYVQQPCLSPKGVE